MIEKEEIAKKVWGWFNKEVRGHIGDNVGDGLPTEGVQEVECKLNEILPRPKRWVNKKEDRWVLLSWQGDMEGILSSRLYMSRENAVLNMEKGQQLQRIELVVRVEE